MLLDVNVRPYSPSPLELLVASTNQRPSSSSLVIVAAPLTVLLLSPSASLQRQLFARSDRVKSVDFHPTEPHVIACVWHLALPPYSRSRLCAPSRPCPPPSDLWAFEKPRADFVHPYIPSLCSSAVSTTDRSTSGTTRPGRSFGRSR